MIQIFIKYFCNLDYCLPHKIRIREILLYFDTFLKYTDFYTVFLNFVNYFFIFIKGIQLHNLQVLITLCLHFDLIMIARCHSYGTKLIFIILQNGRKLSNINSIEQCTILFNCWLKIFFNNLPNTQI